jgi:hypothetical protein
MRLPAFLRDLITAVTLRAYDTVKAQVRYDLCDAPEHFADMLEMAVSWASVRADIRRDLERIALFSVLFRSQADQSRRSDSIDATLGVFLTALLAVGPFAFERSPSNLDRWIIGGGFVLATGAILIALFFVGGREPGPGLAAKLALDLRSDDRGSYDIIMDTTNRAATDPFFRPDQANEDARGAAGDLAHLFMQDRASLRLKRLLTYFALSVTIALSIFAGVRDVVYFRSEDVHAASIPSPALPSGRGSQSENPY